MLDHANSQTIIHLKTVIHQQNWKTTTDLKSIRNFRSTMTLQNDAVWVLIHAKTWQVTLRRKHVCIINMYDIFLNGMWFSAK